MFTKLTIEELPLYHEIGFNKKRMLISFSLCPEANDYFLKISPKADVWAESYKEYGFRPFILDKNNWGFGGIFQKNSKSEFRKGWMTWECQLPKGAAQKSLDEISASINFITSVIELFICENKKAVAQKEKQLMVIEGMVVRTNSHFHQGGFGFSFSRPVLEFCRKIWEDKDLYNKIIGNMEATWSYLTGQKKKKSLDRFSYRISKCQDDVRLISLSCPGDCA